MNWRPSDRLAAGVLSLLLWFLVAASALYWYFRVSGGGPPVSAPLAGHALADATPDARRVLRALGGQEAATTTTAAAPAPPWPAAWCCAASSPTARAARR